MFSLKGVCDLETCEKTNMSVLGPTLVKGNRYTLRGTLVRVPQQYSFIHSGCASCLVMKSLKAVNNRNNKSNIIKKLFSSSISSMIKVQ